MNRRKPRRRGRPKTTKAFGHHLTLYIPKDLLALWGQWGRLEGFAIHGRLLRLIAADLFSQGLIERSVLNQVNSFEFRKNRSAPQDRLSNHYSFVVPEPFRKSILAVMDRYLTQQDPAQYRSAYIWGLVRAHGWVDQKDAA
jgi:hypothetical protein